jgi:aryl-alcohol dehydrogenase-like predicted oxidoreductase
LGVLGRVALAKGFLAGNYQPGAVFPESDVRSAYSTEFNNAQLQLVEEIRRTELPSGQNMAQWALAWCLRHSAVASVVVGCKSEEQVILNAGAAELDIDDRRPFVQLLAGTGS